MAVPIKMPDLGTTVSQVTVVSWLKKEGEPVQVGDPLCEVETDKATSALESVAQGILLRQVVPPGSVVEVGAIVAYVGTPGESLEVAAPPSPGEVADTLASSRAVTAAPLRVSPMVRNLAERLGVALDQVRGTGPEGLITREDVLRARDGQAAGPPPGAPPAETALSKNQLAVARTITKSWHEIVPINVWGRIGVAGALALRQRVQAESGAKLSYDAVFVHVVSHLVKEFPKFRAYFENDRLLTTDSVNVGLAVSAGEDLFIPVVRDADQKPLSQINREVQELADKAARGTLTPAEMAGATFTVSNLGMFPVRAFTAIIPPQQCGILTVGTIEEVVRFREGHAPAADKVVSVILAVDHRFINGRQAAEFLSRLKERVEQL
jgi:pyruvate dehydrogenase E2 component (dihydrolipoamide acetyltransferase)